MPAPFKISAAPLAVSARNLSKTYWFHEKEPGLSGAFKAFFRGRKKFVQAVQGIDFHLHAGELVGFIGPNGAGKTSTLKMLSGILCPTAGTIDVLGHVPHRREKAFLKKIAFVAGQRNRLFWDLPAEEYFQFCQVVYEIPDDRYAAAKKRLVEMADIGDILTVPQRKLSAGQRKRCELVSALLHDPRVIFLDEPTNALDLVNARKLREFIRAKARDGRHGIILTSHNMLDIGEVCDRLVIIHGGQIVFNDDLAALYQRFLPKKQIKIVFDGPWVRDELAQLGDLTRADIHEAVLEVETAATARVAALICGRFSIRDITIMEAPLERIIESIYARQGR
jgi:viologen exporter family transport system ATP-binding protein